MLVLLRLIFGAALVYVVKLAHDNAQTAGAAGMIDSLFYIVGVFGLAIANAIVWAPYFGNRVADAMSGDGPPLPDAPKKKTGLARAVSWTVRFGGLAILAALAFWIWQYRALFNPMTDLVSAWRMGNAPWSAPEIELTVTRIIDAENLTVRNEQGRSFTLRLAGLEAHSLSAYDPTHRAQAEAGRDFLKALVLSNTVHAEITLTNASRVLLAFVRIGDTNVNAAAVIVGHAAFRPDYLGNASLRNRWALLQAHRKATGTAPPPDLKNEP
jgi:endonuclease YncB( thermonuclease family)